MESFYSLQLLLLLLPITTHLAIAPTIKNIALLLLLCYHNIIYIVLSSGQDQQMLLFSGPATLLCCLELESKSESFSSFVLFWFFFLLLPLLGLFFVLPCIENYQKVDLRTITLDVPPQEVTRAESCNYSCALYRLS